MFKSQEKFRYFGNLFFLLAVTVVSIFGGFKPVMAQSDATFITAIEVIAVNGQIAQCKNGVVVDFSTATNERPIEVGDLLTAIGQFLPTANSPSLILANRTRVRKLRDVQFIGDIQAVSENEIKILNQRVLLTPQTKIFNADSLKPGQDAIVVTENTPEGFKAFVIDISPDFGNSIAGTIKAIEGSNIMIEGGFTIANVTASDMEFLRNFNSFSVGAPIIASLKKLPKSQTLKYRPGRIGANYSFPILSSDQIQDIDLENNTITVLNQKVKVLPTTFIGNGDKQIKLSDINIANVESISVELGLQPLINNYMVDYSITYNISVQMKP